MNTDTDTDTDTDADTDVHMKIVCCNHVLNLQTNTGGKAGYSLSSTWSDKLTPAPGHCTHAMVTALTQWLNSNSTEA